MPRIAQVNYAPPPGGNVTLSVGAMSVSALVFSSLMGTLRVPSVVGQADVLDENGWTAFPEHPSLHRKVYVAAPASGGSDTNDGFAPTDEGGGVGPKATIAAGLALMRNGFADHLLLNKGDSWTESGFSITFAGVSEAYRALIGAYGTGARPLIRTEHGGGFIFETNSASHVALVGLELDGRIAGETWRNDTTAVNGTVTTASTDDGITLIDSSATFITDGVQPGWVSRDLTTNDGGRDVLTVDSETQLTMATTFPGGREWNFGDSYVVIENSKPTGIYVEGLNHNVLVEDCKITHYDQAFIIQDNTGDDTKRNNNVKIRRNRVRYCYAYDSPGQGMLCNDTNSITIEGNTFINCAHVPTNTNAPTANTLAHSFYLQWSTLNVKFKDNVVARSGGSTIMMRSGGTFSGNFVFESPFGVLMRAYGPATYAEFPQTVHGARGPALVSYCEDNVFVHGADLAEGTVSEVARKEGIVIDTAIADLYVRRNVLVDTVTENQNLGIDFQPAASGVLNPNDDTNGGGDPPGITATVYIEDNKIVGWGGRQVRSSGTLQWNTIGVEVIAPSTFRRSDGGSWLDEGYGNNAAINTQTFTNGANNGRFTVSSVSDNDIVVTETSLVTEAGATREVMGNIVMRRNDLIEASFTGHTHGTRTVVSWGATAHRPLVSENNRFYNQTSTLFDDGASSGVSFASYTTTVGDTTSTETNPSFYDRTRDLAGYMALAYLANDPGDYTTDALCDRLMEQSKDSWNAYYTARAISSYVRTGLDDFPDAGLNLDQRRSDSMPHLFQDLFIGRARDTSDPQTTWLIYNNMHEGGLSTPRYPSGAYRAVWSGGGTATVSGDGSQTASVAGQLDFNVTPSLSGFVLSMPGSATDIHVFETADAGTYATTHFRQATLDTISSFRPFRFMDEQETNNSIVWLPEHIHAVNEPQTPPPQTRGLGAGDGMAPEWIARLANQSGTDPWVHIKHGADDRYVREFASRLAAELDDARIVFVEYSNEVWNFGFDQAVFARDQGIALGLASDYNPATQTSQFESQMQRRFYAWRSRRIFEIFEEYFGVGRLRRMLCWQRGATSFIDDMLSFDRTIEYVDYVATNAYVGSTIVGIHATQGSYPTGGLANWTVAQLLSWLTSEITTQSAAWTSTINRAANHGRFAMAYEGGQALSGHTGNSSVIQLFYDVQRDAGMSTFYNDLLDDWVTSGGKTFVFYNWMKQFTDTGKWGILEYTGQARVNAPKYDGILDYQGL